MVLLIIQLLPDGYQFPDPRMYIPPLSMVQFDTVLYMPTISIPSSPLASSMQFSMVHPSTTLNMMTGMPAGMEAPIEKPMFDILHLSPYTRSDDDGPVGGAK